MELIKYYIHYKNQHYRGFNLSITKEGTIFLERKHPRKDAQLSRKRGIKYQKTKHEFKHNWNKFEHLGCVIIPLDELAPCKPENTDPQRTISVPENARTINIHIFTLAQQTQQEFKKYDTSGLGQQVWSHIETETYPQLGILVTT